MSRACCGQGVCRRTVKPAEVAQTLSPARLMMAALSMWPVPTRLQIASVMFAPHRPQAERECASEGILRRYSRGKLGRKRNWVQDGRAYLVST